MEIRNRSELETRQARKESVLSVLVPMASGEMMGWFGGPIDETPMYAAMSMMGTRLKAVGGQ